MDALATVLLRRTGRAFLPAPSAAPPPDGGARVRALEADLAERGWLLDAGARGRLAALADPARTQWGDWLLAAADREAGAHRVHVPLFRTFPDTPADPDRLFVERLLAHWFQDSDVRCVLCAGEGGVHPVDPCGHLVCRRCFDPVAYAGCPVCGRRAAGAGYLQPPARPAGPPVRVSVVSLGDDALVAATGERDRLVARGGAPGQQERDDLRVLVDATAPTDLGWLPAVVPSRETAALVGAWALRRAVLPADLAPVVAQVAARWSTATDVARTLWAHAGGDPGLVLPRATGRRPPDEPGGPDPAPRVRALPRPLRAAALAHLDGVGAATAAEDLARHPTVWKRLGERLHPFERVAAHPGAAVAFAALRGTRSPAGSPLGAAIGAAAARYPGRLVLVPHGDGRVSVRSRSFAAAVQQALDGGDVGGALSLLGTRPGELWRRVDHLARVAGDDPALRRALLDAAGATAAGVAPAVLAAAAGELRGRESTVAARPASVGERVAAAGAALRRRLSAGRGVAVEEGRRRRPPAPAPGTPRRVFFPGGSVVRSWTEPERRPPLPAAVVGELRAAVDRELVRRAALLERFDVAVLDASLAAVPAPTRARASSAQLAGWTRGARLTVPALDMLRLFLHWVQPPGVRVDLDLSCAFFRPDWSHAGHCDFTTLRFGGDAAVHSGDLTSAPAPFGATEYLDLAPARLAAAGARWAVPVVFSYNDVPFERLPEAFAGFSLPAAADARFDPGRVVQRFDLRGDTRVLVPFVLDLTTRQLLWTDVHVTGRGYGHRAGRHSANLARLAADLWDHFAAGRRPSLLDLAAWHAAGRAGAVHVADLHAQRAAAVAADPAAVRAAAVGRPSGPLPDLAGRRVLAVVADADGLAPVLGDRCAEASLAAAVVGRAPAPWHTIRPEELLAGLEPVAE